MLNVPFSMSLIIICNFEINLNDREVEVSTDRRRLTEQVELSNCRSEN